MGKRFDFSQPIQKYKLDVKDKKLLDILLEDARLPRSQIAKKLRLSRDSVDYRIKKLEEKGIIIDFLPVVNFEKLGYFLFQIFFLFDEKKPERKQDFITYVKELPQTYSLIEYSDRWDFELHLIAKNIIEFDKFLIDISTEFQDCIIEKNKVEIIRRFSSNYASYLHKEKNNEHILLERGDTVELDKLDKKILELLMKHPQESSYQLAEKIKVSSDTILYRIKRMKKNNVIRKFSILIDLGKLDLQWHTFTLKTSFFSRESEGALKEFAYHNPQIIRSAKTLGGWDILIYMITDSHVQFHKLAFELKKLFSNHIKSYDSWLAYKEHFYKAVPNILLK